VHGIHCRRTNTELANRLTCFSMYLLDQYNNTLWKYNFTSPSRSFYNWWPNNATTAYSPPPPPIAPPPATLSCKPALSPASSALRLCLLATWAAGLSVSRLRRAHGAPTTPRCSAAVCSGPVPGGPSAPWQHAPCVAMPVRSSQVLLGWIGIGLCCRGTCLHPAWPCWTVPQYRSTAVQQYSSRAWDQAGKSARSASCTLQVTGQRVSMHHACTSLWTDSKQQCGRVRSPAPAAEMLPAMDSMALTAQPCSPAPGHSGQVAVDGRHWPGPGASNCHAAMSKQSLACLATTSTCAMLCQEQQQQQQQQQPSCLCAYV
jgi:hypothetical protein